MCVSRGSRDRASAVLKLLVSTFGVGIGNVFHGNNVQTKHSFYIIMVFIPSLTSLVR